MSRSHRKLWGGRFTRSTAEVVERFTHSLSMDQRLARYDLLGSIAHATMLGKTKIIPVKDSQRLVRTLQFLLKELERGKLCWDSSAEDIHTAIQQEVEKRAGSSAGWLHTARSRNDQVMTAFRLFCKDQLTQVAQSTFLLQKKIIRQAEVAKDLVMPGYTHLRHAQPVLVSHLFVSYVTMLERDKHRFWDALFRLDELPLGSGALTGSGLPIDRVSVAKSLQFSRVSTNSIDAVTERDFVVEILSALGILSIHLSRIAEDLILWSTAEFGFLSFDERFLTGSSMMPQKQNPDFLELVRGGSSRILGNLMAICTLLKGLSSGYQRDLQLDKEILFEALDRMERMLSVLAQGFKGIRWNRKELANQLNDESMYATDLAEYLIEKGVPFAQAHRAVGQLLAFAHTKGSFLRSLSLTVMQRFSPKFDRGVFHLFSPRVSVNRKKSFGSTNPARVAHEIRRWKKLLESRHASI